MKSLRFTGACYVFVVLLALTGCAPANLPNASSASTHQMYLYGEAHGEKKVLDKELELWSAYYHNENMRHMFIELPYYTAEFLNQWMKSDNDDILNMIYSECERTAWHNPSVLAYYQEIKRTCPETMFHGTDVGHQYDTTGQRYLAYLQNKNMENSDQYRLALEAIEQGKYYYEHDDGVYRENKMVENFIREFDKLSGDKIMGVYGSAHTGIAAKDYATNSIPCMANQLKKHYGKAVHSEDLSELAKDIAPMRVDKITVNGKEYEASYFGKQDLTGLIEGYSSREFWRLESAYDDFKDKKKSGEKLPYNNYPMLIEIGQVFVIDYVKTDGSVERNYQYARGNKLGSELATEGFQF